MTRPASGAPSGSGRSATCRRCTDSGVVNLCSCLIHCGHPKCTGSGKPPGVPPVPTRPTKASNPEGYGSGTNQYTKGKRPIRRSPAREGGTKPPEYDGPRGKTEDKRPRGWRRGKRA